MNYHMVEPGVFTVFGLTTMVVRFKLTIENNE